MIWEFLKTRVKSLFGELAPGYGRGYDLETRSIGAGDPQPKLEETDADRLWSLTQAPYIFAGIRSRMIGRLWISASGIGDSEKKKEAYAPPQILFPPYRQDGNQEHLDFTRWQFDERLNKEGLRCIIDQIQHSYISYGRAVVEIDWQREQGGKYPGKVVINDLCVRDPQRFVIDPKDLYPGIYLKSNAWNYTVTASDKLPDRKFAIITETPTFGNPYGISEIALIDMIQKQLYNTTGFYARGLERSGVGAIIGKYAKEMAGKGTDAKARRAEFATELTKLKSSTITMMSASNDVQELSTNIADDAFVSFIDVAISCISLVLTGDPTTLKETKYGTYAQAEGKGARVKGALEQNDASLICDGFNYQIIPWILEWNWQPGTIDGYPMMQLIEPDLIQPTISAEQQPLSEEQIDIETQNEEKEESRKEEQETKEEPDRKEGLDTEKKTENASEFAEQEEPEQVETASFPDKNEPPEIFGDVLEEAQKAIDGMKAYTRKQFDALPEDQQHGAFTITALKNGAKSLSRIQAMKQAIADTISETNEAKAWQQYKAKAKQIFTDMEFRAAESELMVSFRYARQYAYNAGINALIEKQKGLWGVQVRTQEDAKVRPSHRRLDGIVRPPNDKIWEQLQFPLSFNCRCYRLPITAAQAKEQGLAFTPDGELPNLDTIERFEG